jgi:hypothetical protein
MKTLNQNTINKTSIAKSSNAELEILANFLAGKNWDELNMTSTFQHSAKALRKAVKTGESAETIAKILKAYRSSWRVNLG